VEAYTTKDRQASVYHSHHHTSAHHCRPAFCPCSLQSAIEAKIKDVKDAVAADDAAKMKSTMEALQQEVIKMGQAMYSQGGAAGAPGAGGGLRGGGGHQVEGLKQAC
jgi:hypothetical protein